MLQIFEQINWLILLIFEQINLFMLPIFEQINWFSLSQFKQINWLMLQIFEHINWLMLLIFEQINLFMLPIFDQINWFVQSNPYKMFAADFQPSWPSRPKTNVTLFFFFLETLHLWFKWNFCRINQFWATAPMDLKNHDGTKKIVKKSFFRLNFEVLLINRYLWNFTWLLQFAWI